MHHRERMHRMTHLELRHLYNFCRKYGIDFQEIDNSITYYENLAHLKEIAKMLDTTGDLFEIERLCAMQEEYMKEHALTYYVSFQVGEPPKPLVVDNSPRLFSLRKMSYVGFSLRSMVGEKVKSTNPSKTNSTRIDT